MTFSLLIRRLLPLIVALWATIAWGHPSPNSAVQLRLRSDRIVARLLLPVVELKLGWDKPFPLNDAKAVVDDYGEALKRYVANHVHPVAPDGRPWQVHVTKVSPVLEAVQDVEVDLEMLPPAGAPAQRA